MGLGWNRFMTTGISSAEWRIEENQKGQLIVQLKSNIDINNTASLYKSLIPTITKKRPSLLTLDLSQVTYLDDYGTLAVLDLESSITANGPPSAASGSSRNCKAAALAATCLPFFILTTIRSG